MQRIIPVLLLAIAIPSCASTPTQSFDEAVAPSQMEYNQCMRDAAEKLKDSKASPSEIAIAAQGECDQAFTEFSLKLETYIFSLVSNDDAGVHRKRARMEAEQIRTEVSDRVVGFVVKHRVPASR